MARGFILIVIPYMFYESFVTDEKQHFPWVRDAVSKPYIKSAGDTLRGVLVQYAPSSLTNPPATPPPAGEQQGFLNQERRFVTIVRAGPQVYMSVMRSA